MITLKGVLFGIGLSFAGTFVWCVFLIWHPFRKTVLPPGVTGAVGFDITSLYHNVFHVPGYWLFVLGLILTGMGIVALWPNP